MPTLDTWQTHLRQCGWEDAGRSAPGAVPSSDEWREAGATGGSVWEACGGGPRLVLARLEDGRLPDPAWLFARYLDCPLEARRLALKLGEKTGADYWLVGDGRREYWRDVARDACLGQDAGEQRVRDAVWARLTLDQVRQGALEEPTTRSTRRLGEELRCWTTLWINELGSAGSRPPGEVERLFLLLALAYKASTHPVGPEVTRQALDRLVSGDGLQGLSADLGPVFKALEQQFPGPLTHGATELLAWIDSLTARKPEIVGRLAMELPMISVSKVSVDVLLESLGDPRVESVGWRQTLEVEPAQLEARLHVDGRHVLESLHIDLDREGLAWLVHCARWAVRYWTRRAAEEKADSARTQRGWQMDLTLPWPAGVDENGDIANPTLYALANSLRVKSIDPMRRRAAELLLDAVAMEETSEEPETMPSELGLESIWLDEHDS